VRRRGGLGIGLRGAALESLRLAISSAAKAIEEGIQWNSPGFRLGETWFATFDVRGPKGFLLVLHAVRFASGDDVAAKTRALRGVVRQWTAVLSRARRPP
jgi:hypothetical protein